MAVGTASQTILIRAASVTKIHAERNAGSSLSSWRVLEWEAVDEGEDFKGVYVLSREPVHVKQESFRRS